MSTALARRMVVPRPRTASGAFVPGQITGAGTSVSRRITDLGTVVAERVIAAGRLVRHQITGAGTLVPHQNHSPAMHARSSTPPPRTLNSAAHPVQLIPQEVTR